MNPLFEEEIGAGPVHGDQAIRDRRDYREPDARDGREDVEGDNVGAGGDGEEHGGGEGDEAEKVRLPEADQGDHALLKAGGEQQRCGVKVQQQCRDVQVLFQMNFLQVKVH